MMGLEDQGNLAYVDPTVYVVTGQQTIINRVIDSQGQVQANFTYVNIPIDLCSKYYKAEDIIEKNLELPLDMYYCFQTEFRRYSRVLGLNESVQFSQNDHLSVSKHNRK